MKAVQKFVTQDSFDARGVLVPAGHIATFDEERLNGEEDHIKDLGEAPVSVPIEMAAIAPTGPNPRVPQQIPPDAVQGPGGTYMTPGRELVGEVTNPQEERLEAAGLRDPDREAEMTEQLREVMGEAAVDGTATGEATTDTSASLVDGKVADITAQLGSQTDDQLAAMLAAEREGQGRTTLISAIEAEQAERAAKNT